MTPSRLLRLPSWLACLAAAGAGGLAPLSLAPFNCWPLGLVSLTVFSLLLWQQDARQCLLRGFSFGLAYYGLGVSWVFVSIHFFGGAPIILAALLTFLFVAFLAFVFSLPFYMLGRWLRNSSLALLWTLPLIWILGEWLRSWLLTGFPWLYLGYGHVDTWLAGWAPVFGVYGPGLILALTAGLLAQLLLKMSRLHQSSSPLLASWGLLVIGLWLGGLGLQHIHWTKLAQEPIKVALVQPNIAQDIKWQDFYALPTLELLLDMSEEHWDKDWIIWPEAAVPLTYHQALPFLNQVNQRANDTDTGLITGIIYDDTSQRRYYNSLAGFGTALGIYHKRRLVPFGEYVPLEDWLRGLIHFFDLPTSIISLGPQQQGGLKIGQVSIAPAICYELAYPGLMAQSARQAQVLLNVSNLGWFGDSLGPHQFVQIGQMRALETGRYLVYNTNNGISALINTKGKIEQQTPAFVAETLAGEIYPATGMTPFMRWGDWPLMILALLGLTTGLLYRSFQK